MGAEPIGVFESIRNEVKKSFVNRLLENCTVEELSDCTKIPVSEILDILNK